MNHPFADPEPEQLLTAEQVAKRWQVSAAHVYRLARDGKIPSVKLGRFVRFRLDAIQAFEYADAWSASERRALDDWRAGRTMTAAEAFGVNEFD